MASLARNAHGQCFLKRFVSVHGFGGFTFFESAQVSYEMLIAIFCVSKKRPCAVFLYWRFVGGVQKLLNVSCVLCICGTVVQSSNFQNRVRARGLCKKMLVAMRIPQRFGAVIFLDRFLRGCGSWFPRDVSSALHFARVANFHH